MVLYYSGTGNSEYVAKRISKVIGDQHMNLFETLRNGDLSTIHSQSPFVIVCPTYGWQIPHILRDWLTQARLTGSSAFYFVLTCGDDIGNAGQHAARLCASIGKQYRGCARIVMPENYIALFNAPQEPAARAIIEKAEPDIDAAARTILDGGSFPEYPISLADRLKSGIVNRFFYSFIISAKKFTAAGSCSGCGKCARNCVMNNITMADGRPRWGTSCTHCMACICGCPEGAIEYGQASRGKPRYQCPISAD